VILSYYNKASIFSSFCYVLARVGKISGEADNLIIRVIKKFHKTLKGNKLIIVKDNEFRYIDMSYRNPEKL
jgi:hypothetical protein